MALLLPQVRPDSPHPAATAPPRVSAVIPAYNAQAHIGACLDSVLSQSGPFALEVIVVDDGSADDTLHIVRQRAGVQCIAQPNAGPSAARNTGIAAASGEFVAFLDADDLWPPGKLAAQLQILQAQPEAALVSGDCRQFDAGGWRERTEFGPERFGHAAWGAGRLVPRAYARLLENNFITTGSVVARRTALVEAQGFDPGLRLAEDLDLWLRIARRHPIAWCEQECLHRRRHDSNISRDAQAVGLAYLEVLARHAASWEPGAAERLGVDAAQLAAGEYLHLADLAAAGGQAGTALRRLWRGLTIDPRPSTAWRAAKSALKLGVRSLGPRA
jgi:glycosyltransferase involved in cell wall biosynthesis